MLRVQLAQLPADATKHAGGAAAFDHNSCGMRAGKDLNVLPPLGFAQISVGRADAPAVVRRELVVTCPFLACPVEVGVSRNPAPLRCGDEGLDQFMWARDAGNTQRSGPAVQLLITKLSIVFELDEIRQHVAPAPAGIAEFAPSVVVARLPTHNNEAINRARAAEHAPARPIDSTTIHVRLGF